MAKKVLKSKRLQLTDEVIKALTIEAAKNDMVFKPFAQKILTDHATKITLKDKKVKSWNTN